MIRVFVLSLVFLWSTAGFSAEGDWMKLPPYKRTVLPNGVTLLLMERHGTPLISLNLALRSGSILDPKGKEGLADVTNDLLRKGTRRRSANEIAEALDFIGAELATVADLESTRVRTEFLKKDLATGLDIFADMILNPVFPEEEVMKLVSQRVDQLKAEKDAPGEVLGRYYKQFLFDAHPYGRFPAGCEASVARLKREDIVEFHGRTYLARNIVISAAGDFATADMERLLKERFGGLPAQGLGRPVVPPPDRIDGNRLLLVDKPDATQTYFALGGIGIPIKHPDRVAINLVNTVFGGRFTSRLNTALRIESGLSYGARSSFDRNREPGSFSIASFTKNESTEEALDLTLKVLGDLHEKGLTAEELASAKTYVKGQFGPKVETPQQLAELIASFEIYGLDASEVNEFATRVDAVSAADALRVIREVYPRERLAFSIIGKASEIAPVIKKYATAIAACSIQEPGYGPAAD